MAELFPGSLFLLLVLVLAVLLGGLGRFPPQGDLLLLEVAPVLLVYKDEVQEVLDRELPQGQRQEITELFLKNKVNEKNLINKNFQKKKS